MPLLSVIIPTYNSEKTIERCLKSLLLQKFQDFEVCVMDGGSSDKTLSIVCSVRSCFRNIRIISESDKGAYDAMNKGIDTAQGDWLYFLGSDDEVFDENVFLDVFSCPSLKNNGFVYGNVYLSGDTPWAKDGQLYDGPFDIEKILLKNICHQSVFYRKELFKRFGKYKSHYQVCADWEVNIRFFTRTDSVYLNRTIAKFYGGGISSQKVSALESLALENIRAKILKDYKVYKFISRFNLKHLKFIT